MSHSKHRWFDIVALVEQANLKDQQLLKKRQRQIYQRYLQDNSDTITMHRQQKDKKINNMKAERNRLECLARDQMERVRIDKQIRMARQLQYQQENKRLLEGIKQAEMPQKPFIQNKFLRLMEQSDKRKQIFKSNLRMQNQINHMQAKMKREQKESEKIVSKYQMNQFSKKIENYYNRQNQDKDKFKNRYLKLNIFQQKSIKSQKNLPSKGNIDEDYLKLLDHQVREKKNSDRNKEVLDEQLSKFNQDLEGNDRSPAFLGRNPLSYERRKQLSYLDRSLNKSIRPHLKTQESRQKYTFKTQVPPTNENRNLNQIYKTYQVTLRSHSKSQSDQKQKDSSNKGQKLYQSKQSMKLKRQYMKFDIVSGKNTVLLV